MVCVCLCGSVANLIRKGIMEINRTKKVSELGQSLWLDNIQRSELINGSLKRLVDEDGLSGVTSNPTIFMKAITGGKEYDEQIARLVTEGKTAIESYDRLTIADIRQACGIMAEVFDRTGGNDGFVSIELDPRIAYDTDKSVDEARRLFSEIDSQNMMVKVPGTPEGLPVIRKLTSEGFNVNVTLLFSPKQYENAAMAYIEGLEERAEQGKDLSEINSVASFFVSRIDTKVDKKIDALMEMASDSGVREKIKDLRGKAAINVAKVTYGKFKDLFLSSSFENLKAKGAKVQRTLWASTGAKDPTYSDVKYVDSLIGPYTVNTLPPATLDAFRDHGIVSSTLEEDMDKSAGILEKIVAMGIDLDGIYQELLDEGVKAFEKSYLDLIAVLEKRIK